MVQSEDQPEAVLLGIDWGSSNRRAYVLDRTGELLHRHEDEGGILQVQGDFEGSLRSLLQTLGLRSADIVMSGMVGSRNGWVQAPYLSTAEPLSELGRHLLPVPTVLPGIRCRIAPGYRYIDPNGLPDVMRGEETQVLGALRLSSHQNEAHDSGGGWFLLPGTHSKWVKVQDGRITEFHTFMTGELYGLLTRHGTLAKVVESEAAVQEAFAAGLQAARHGGFTHTAFCCRALVVTDMMPAEHTASYLSGLLIGAELYDILRRAPEGMLHPVQVIGSQTLSRRYLAALELLGIEARAWQPDGVYVAALRALFDIKR